MAPVSEQENIIDLTKCSLMQREEWEVLESIYPDVVSSDTSNGVKLEIPVEFPESRIIHVIPELPVTSTDVVQPDMAPSETSKRTAVPNLSLSSLPPLLLDIILPPSYPYSPPVIASIHATNSWLHVGFELQRKLLEMWQDGEGVLYSWVEWIQSGEFLEALGLVVSSEGEEVIRLPHPAPHVLVPVLKAHDRFIQLSRFSQMSYECQICLTSIKGARCILLSCTHVFCRSCLEDFWKLCIAEGDVGRVGCPDPECVKAVREANEEEVRRVVTEEEVRRWRWLREKRELEKDPTIIHCPLSFCQRAVPKPRNVDDESGWSRLRTCPECNYSFCAYCRRTWHGPHTDCPLSTQESLVLKYVELPEDSPERVEMEHRYGVNNIRRLVAKYEEERANKQWLESSTTECPNCHVHVEKSVGCNHMTCSKCRQHFCYRCGERLLASDPYMHFSAPGPCFNRLYEFEGIDNEWQPVEGFDAL